MFSGGQRHTSPTFHVEHDHLQLRPYNAKLGQVSSDFCAATGAADSDACLFATRTAVDCVMRNKVSKYGDLMDNLGQCKYHIDHLKQVVGPDFASRADDTLKRLNNMNQSFV